MFNYNNLVHYLPETVILITVLIQFVYSLFNIKRISSLTSIIALALTVALLITAQVFPFDLYSSLFKIMICVSALIILCLKSRRVFAKNITHFNMIYLLSLFFLMMIVNSTNYLALYLNLEFFSISMYFLLSMDRFTVSIAETLKYMVSSVVASSFLLLGFAFMYGLTGTLSFQGVGNYLNSSTNYSFSTYIIPYMLIIAGLFFKLGVFPFANWMIDIFTNIDTKIVTFISIVPKLAIFAVLIKVLGSFVSFETSFLMIIFALFTGIFGVLYGIKARNLKTIMACSSYINISYMLIALALYTKISLAAMIFYWVTYIFMNIGAFAGIIALEHSNLADKDLDFKGYFYKNPLFSTCFAICIISLLGFPLTSGFIAKIYLISGVLNSGIIVFPLILAMIMLMIISAYFYIHIIKNMFMVLPYDEVVEIKTKSANKFVMYVCTFITIVIGFLPAWIIKICESVSIYI